MARTSKHEEMRRRLKRSTIRIAAREGIENLTTKKISRASGLAEVYIYRYFEGKDDLLLQCFLDIEKQIGEVISQACMQSQMLVKDLESAIRIIWYVYWDFLIRHPEKTLFYFRYYLSTDFTGEVSLQRKKNIEHLVSMAYLMIRNANIIDENAIWTLFDHATDSTLICAVRMIRDKVIREKTKPTAEEVELIYQLIVSPTVKLANTLLIESEKRP